MTDLDPLRERFEAFRDRSVRTARPPGPESIPGVLRRRRRRKAWTAAAAAAIAVLALAVLPTLGPAPHPPDPAISDSPTASPTGHEPAPTSAPPGSGSPGVQAGAPAGSATAKPSSCATPVDGNAVGDPYVWGNDVYNGGPYAVRPTDFFDKCPAYRLRFVQARYAWNRDRQMIVLTSSTEVFLTKASPTYPAPVFKAPDPCGEGLVALQTTKPIPTSISNSVQDSPGAYLNVLQKHAYAAFSHWTFKSTAEVRATSGCGPPAASPTLSATP
ncbi:MAG TPA: hypothetical protein VL738_28800 [Dactylosporangium sp.]|jgi:hypothetical protein|nr:hypothetical protein [Dactylosporangium sp.]